jgi:hypothetical protein
VIPAAQLNHNTHTLAIVVIGHGGKDPLKADTRRAIVEILHRYPVLQAFGGHRDVVATECPGDRFYARIPELARTAGLRRCDGRGGRHPRDRARGDRRVVP